MIQYRKKLLAWLFEKSQRFYTLHFKKKKKPWGISKKDLLALPSQSLGYQLGLFLETNGFELIEKVERHDAYHVLTGYGTQAQDEIALQYLCYGNGKRSLYSLLVLSLGTLILPDYLPYYLKSYGLGKKSHHFHDYDYKKLLEIPLADFRHMVFSREIQSRLPNSTSNEQ
ncbi:MAG: hypothetical protein R2793_06465 [Flavobacteriaceae bacterium]